MKPTTTSLVLRNFFCVEQKRDFAKNQLYLSTFERAEILHQKKYSIIVKIEQK